MGSEEWGKASKLVISRVCLQLCLTSFSYDLGPLNPWGRLLPDGFEQSLVHPMGPQATHCCRCNVCLRPPGKRSETKLLS